MNTKYYPYLDLLKFVCCVCIIASHAKPHYYLPTPFNGIVSEIVNMALPIFFMISAFLLARKFDGHSDWQKVKKFVYRLALLYFIWSVIMLPDWMPGYIKHNPENWLSLLPVKLLLRGAAHGSWFIVSLIYGTLIAFVFNKLLGYRLTIVIFFLLTLYIKLIETQTIPDYIGLESINSIVELRGSPFRALIYIQLGLVLHWSGLSLVSTKYLDKLRGGVNLYITIAVTLLPFFFPYWIKWMCLFFSEFFIVILSLKQPKQGNPNFTTLRKMSIIIYFVHAIFITGFRYLFEHGIVEYQFGLLEFLVVLIISCIIAYIIVKFSEKYKILRYLY